MKLFVTGLSGFVGTWLQRRLNDPATGCPYELIGTDPGDILDRPGLAKILAAARPDAVIHLAAQSNVPAAIADPLTTVEVNTIGTLNLLDALESAGFSGRLLFIGSGDQYGRVDSESLPLPETAAIQPRNPYAASKAAAELLVLERARRGRIDAVCARSFNHTGPDQDARFVLPGLARQIVEIGDRPRFSGAEKRGLSPISIVAGDLDVTRDFLDVRDVVSAYLQLLINGESGGVYNVCSGIERHLGDTLATMMTMAGVEAAVERASHLMRPAEQRRSCGDNRRLCSLGWQPVVPWETTLANLLDYARQQLIKEKNT